MIARAFGSYRGAVRLALSYPEVALGLAQIVAPDPSEIRRLVFVCHGNICRSAFADALARKAGLNAISFGLSTSSGKGAYPGTLRIAAEMGHDLGEHRTTTVDQYAPAGGDLLLAMETRHLRRIADDPRLSALPRSLLGLYARPRIPHLHDPYSLHEDYMRTVMARIAGSIPVLKASFPNAAVA
jgi:protein-tyrosine phosphatase